MTRLDFLLYSFFSKHQTNRNTWHESTRVGAHEKGFTVNADSSLVGDLLYNNWKRLARCLPRHWNRDRGNKGGLHVNTQGRVSRESPPAYHRRCHEKDIQWIGPGSPHHGVSVVAFRSSVLWTSFFS